jgi:hypothetical protein
VDFGVGEYAETPEASANRQQAEAHAVEKVTHAFAALAASATAAAAASNTASNADSSTQIASKEATVRAASAAVAALHAPGSGRSIHSLMSALSSSSNMQNSANPDDIGSTSNNGGRDKDACVGGIISLAMANMQAQSSSSSSSSSTALPSSVAIDVGLPVELYNVALEACIKTEQFHDFLATAVIPCNTYLVIHTLSWHTIYLIFAFCIIKSRIHSPSTHALSLSLSLSNFFLIFGVSMLSKNRCSFSKIRPTLHPSKLP